MRLWPRREMERRVASLEDWQREVCAEAVAAIDGVYVASPSTTPEAHARLIAVRQRLAGIAGARSRTAVTNASVKLHPQ